MALQLAGMGFFAMELNAGWEEWFASRLPAHSGQAEASGIRCECSRLS